MSSNACPSCIHYRQPAPLAAIIKAQIAETHEEVIKAIDEISAKDESHAMQEGAITALRPDGLPPNWPHRPRTVPYCGIYEDKNWFYVCGKKNPDGNCADYEPRIDTGPSNCAECAHRVRACGDQTDGELLYQIGERIAYALVPHPAINAEYQRLEKASGALKAAAS